MQLHHASQIMPCVTCRSRDLTLVCHKCHKRGHFRAMCKSKNIRKVHKKTDHGFESDGVFLNLEL